jgi:hypothetical protein
VVEHYDLVLIGPGTDATILGTVEKLQRLDLRETRALNLSEDTTLRRVPITATWERPS